MSDLSIHKQILRKAAALLVPALLIVGTNYIGNSKVESHSQASDKTGIEERSVAMPNVVFEAAEESESEDLTNPDLVYVGPGDSLKRIVLTSEAISPSQIFDPVLFTVHSLSPRAPPAL